METVWTVENLVFRSFSAALGTAVDMLTILDYGAGIAPQNDFVIDVVSMSLPSQKGTYLVFTKDRNKGIYINEKEVRG